MADLQVIPSNAYVQRWKEIYQGSPSWVQTKFSTLAGRIQKRDRKQFRGAKMVCKEFTSLMYSEFPEIEANDTIQAILDRSNFGKNIAPFSEKVLALGGGAFKLYTKNGELYIDYVPADRFIPISWNENGIFEADFINYIYHKNIKYIEVEKHRKTESGYTIYYDYYSVSAGKYLTKTSAGRAGVNKSDDDLRVTIPTNTPLFSYIKLPEANNIDFDSPLGVSVFGNSEDTLEGLDIAFDAMQQEIVLGRRRIIVPTSAIRMVTDPNNPEQRVRYFDPSDEIYEAFDSDDPDKMKIMDATVELRIEELRSAVQTYLDILSIQVGFSAGYLTFDGQSGVKTATEIISDNSKTHKTKVALENAFKEGIEGIIESIGALTNTNVDNFSIEYQDNIQEDRNAKTDYWTNRLNNRTITLETFLMKIDGLTEKEAKIKAKEIRESSATGNLDDLTGFDL